ncbi:MAG: hypothetical protein JNK83_15550 [Rhizobiales bacterium]|nr:hypothetical protein [Hyphomicrobiales bacterium]
MLMDNLSNPTFWLGVSATIFSSVVAALFVQWIAGKAKVLWHNQYYRLDMTREDKHYPSIKFHKLVVMNFGRRAASDLQISLEGSIIKLTVKRVKKGFWGDTTLNFDEKPTLVSTSGSLQLYGFGHLECKERLELEIWTDYLGDVNSVRFAQGSGQKTTTHYVFFREVDLWISILKRMLPVLALLTFFITQVIQLLLKTKASP